MQRQRAKTAKEVNQDVGEEMRSLLLEHDEPAPPLQTREGDDDKEVSATELFEGLLEQDDPDEYIEPSLTQEELIALKWQLFGKCPNCHEEVKGYSSGPFNAKHYKSLQDRGIDALTGHRQSCPSKWLKA